MGNSYLVENLANYKKSFPSGVFLDQLENITSACFPFLQRFSGKTPFLNGSCEFCHLPTGNSQYSCLYFARVFNFHGEEVL